VVHYSEVALKGKNRPEFVRVLKKNLRRALSGLDPDVRMKDGRLFVVSPADPSEVAGRLSKVFGVAWFAEVSSVEADYSAIKEAVLDRALASPQGSFKIVPRRSDKTFPMSSLELATKLGSEVVAATAKRVDLDSPGVSLHVDVIRGKALVYSDRASGPGGLPVGTAGRVVHLFSGGIDSPVAAWLMMKRGCRPVYLHFYLAPTPEYPLQSKITELVKVLGAYSGKSTLVLVPFAEYQLATFGAPGELEPSLFRRFMRITAESIAPRFGANGISTGDSLSQAASQTLWNIGAFDEGSTLPILRPLLTYDKEEIITLAKRIGTYDLSLLEYKDCCAIVSRHPRTRAKAAAISEYAEEVGFTRLAWKSVEQGTLVTYDPADGTSKVVPLADTFQRAVSRAQRRTSPIE
jgi:thiamine biosynthesis protein ThiI